MVRCIKIFQDEKKVIYDYYTEAHMNTEPGRFEYNLISGNPTCLKLSFDEKEHNKMYYVASINRIDRYIANNQPLPDDFTVSWY